MLFFNKTACENIEEEELLPPYVCTVYKEGYVKMKFEMIRGDLNIDESWRKVYFKLTGTKLDIFHKEKDPWPFYTVSLYKAFCGVPIDYYQSENVLRLSIIPLLDQFLFEPLGDSIQLISWSEHLHSAANISSDIATRRMPRAHCYARDILPIRQEYSQPKTVKYLIGDLQVHVPTSICLISLLFE